MKASMLCLLIFHIIAYVMADVLPEKCSNANHNHEVVTACLKFLDDYDTVAQLKAAMTACQVHETVQDCVKNKGHLCKNQGNDLYGVSGLFKKACENEDDEETLWKFFTDAAETNHEKELQLEHDFSHCLEESALHFFDFTKLLFSDEHSEDEFEFDASKLFYGMYVCAVSTLAKNYHLDVLSLDRLAKGFLELSGVEAVEKLELCKSKLALPHEVCEHADKCMKDEDHNDDVALKCFDEFDRDVTDYSVFKGKDKSTELYNKVKHCVEEQGGFCHGQSNLGPALLHVFEHVSEHEHDGDVWWDLLTKVEHVSDDDEAKFEDHFVHCLNESNGHFLNPHHLSVQNFDQLENYFESLYVCVVASFAKTFQADYHSVGRLANAFVEKLGFEVDEGKFCEHTLLSLPTALCAA